MTFHIWEWTKTKAQAEARRKILDVNSSDDIVLEVVPIAQADLHPRALATAQGDGMKYAVGQHLVD